MNNVERLNEIINELNDNRSKLSALFSLYNASLINAEIYRANLTSYFQTLIDCKNNLSTLTQDISKVNKSERESVVNRKKSQINQINNEIVSLNKDFNSTCDNYKVALKECGSLKTEYKQSFLDLRKEFKAQVNEETPSALLKLYKRQVHSIKAILDRIESLISDYNVKRNKVDEDSTKFDELYSITSSLVERLKSIA